MGRAARLKRERRETPPQAEAPPAYRKAETTPPPKTEEVLLIRMDLKTRRLNITAPDDFGLALSMLQGAAIALKQATEKREKQNRVVAPKVEGVTAEQARALGVRIH